MMDEGDDANADDGGLLGGSLENLCDRENILFGYYLTNIVYNESLGLAKTQ